MAYKAVIFDMDGTILDTLEDLKNSLNNALTECGYPERTLDEVRAFVGNGIRKLVERGVPAGTPAAATEAVFARFNPHYAAHCADNTRPYDGVPSAIAALRQKGYKTAVVSNKSDYAVQALCKQYFDGLFDYAIGAKDGVQKKPAPDMVNEVLRALNLRSTDAVYIGDTEVDTATAANAHMACITVNWGFRDKEHNLAHGAKIFVDNARELPAAIERSGLSH